MATQIWIVQLVACVVVCALILTITFGGAIPTTIGLIGARICALTARKTSRTIYGRLAICVATVIMSWTATAVAGPLQALAQTSPVSTAAPASLASGTRAAGRPLADLLNADGTLNLSTGYSGSLDPSGWRMQTVAGGSPRFVPAAPNSPNSSGSPASLNVADDQYWDPRFQPQGTNAGAVYAAVVSGTSTIVGGSFTSAGGMTGTNHIAAWDGRSWSPLGAGLSDTVDALAVGGNKLYAASYNTTNNTSSIQAWNGSNWTPLGTGLTGLVAALAVSGNSVYAGGTITAAGSTPLHGIAQWNGSWSALGNIPNNGVYGGVNALVITGTTLYVGGHFNLIWPSLMSANNIAKWDISGSSWSALGNPTFNGATGPVYALAVNGNTLYVGGAFNFVEGNTPANEIAKWDIKGSSWSDIDGGMGTGTAYVYALAVGSNGTLYAGGLFNTAGGHTAIDIAQWNGSQWSALDTGINPQGQVYALAVNGPMLYAGGPFSTAGGVTVSNIAAWDGSNWHATGAGLNAGGIVYALAVDRSGTLYAGGGFIFAGGVTVSNIAKWDGSNWSPLGNGLNGTVYALAVDRNGTLYAGGDFTMSWNTPVKYVAKWDINGNQWSALGPPSAPGMDGEVRALVVGIDHTVYAGGAFRTAGGYAAHNIAKWDGNRWSALGPLSAPGMDNGMVYALALKSDDVTLYAGGRFTSAGGNAAKNVAVWDGHNWYNLGDGVGDRVGDTVRALALGNDGQLFAGGHFLIAAAGRGQANNIAVLTNGQWSPVDDGDGMDIDVLALVMHGSTLYAGGRFTMAGGVSAARVAALNGRTWSPLGSGTSSGTNDSVNALTVYSNALAAGGSFITAGAKPSIGVGVWNGPFSPAPTPTPCPHNLDGPSSCLPAPTTTPTYAPGQIFSDVPPSNSFFTQINWCYNHGIISGYPDMTFRPNNGATRGQVTKMITLAAGWTIDTSGGPHFTDIAGTTFYNYILTAWHHAVIGGYPDGTFRPNNPITRGQFSKVVVLAKGWSIDTSGGPHFTDVPTGSTFYEYVETAYNHGIISGYSDGTFRPNANMTRGQLAKLIYGAYGP